MRYDTAVPVARGGMGEVARAWDPELERFVALKFLRFENPELEERMLREARAQARINHPNVCPVYEVGRHDGRVFIAMQFIDGRTLDEAAASLGLEQKVTLMRTVAEAVHAAHAAGLVHRDLKPANIMVEDDAEGGLKPWVLDFGVAREHEVPGATVTGQVVGTPGYIAPEQARGETSTLDRRTDVFSLGVILYELLGGGRPFAGDSDVEMLISLLKDQPVALRRRAPDVPRDLETIVMKCLEEERGRRYDSARALADDLGRFLAGEPVLARPTGVVRRLRARARRNKATAALLGAAALAVAILAVALVGVWVTYTIELRRERDAARQARANAEQRAEEANEVSDFVVGLFGGADPFVSRGESITARQLLDDGAARAELELAGQPLTLARMLEVMAESYLGIGLDREGQRLAERSLALRREAAGEDSLEAAASLHVLGRMLGHSDEGEARLREALAIRRRHLPETDTAVADVKLTLAKVLVQQGELEEAEKLCGDAYEVHRAQDGPDGAKALVALDLRASILRRKGDLDGAAALYADLLARRRRLLGEGHPNLGAAYNNLAFVQRLKGDMAGAEHNYRQALAVCRQVFGEAHPNTLQVMQNLAAVLELTNRSEEALALLRHIVEVRRTLVPAGDWRVGADLLGGVGRVLLAHGRYAEAEPVLREGLGIYRAALGPGHSWTALAGGELAACLFALGRSREANALVTASLSELEALDGLPPPVRLGVERNAEYLDAVGQHDLARRHRALAARFAAATSRAAAGG